MKRQFSKITVIGGSGFVGTNLCRKLADGDRSFEIIDIKPSRSFPEKYKFGDVRDIQSLRRSITGDLIVNLAAIHRDDIRDKSAYYRTNVEGAANIAHVCSEKNIRKVVFTSSVAVYGFTEDGTGETGEINPFNEYGKTKYLAEEEFRRWNSLADNQLIIIRPTVIFGEGNRGNVYSLFEQIANQRFIMIGSGKNRKSMAYIGNIVAFLEKCIDADRRYAVFNYVDTPDIEMNKLVRQVRRVLLGKDSVGIRFPYWVGLMLGLAADGVTLLSRKKLPVSSIRIKKFCSSTVFRSSKSHLDGFQSPFSLEEGINRTLQSEFISSDTNREIFYTE